MENSYTANYTRLKEILGEAVNLSGQQSVGPADKEGLDDAREYIDHNEYQLAFDRLVDVLNDRSTAVPEVISRLREAAELMELDTTDVDRLVGDAVPLLGDQVQKPD